MRGATTSSPEISEVTNLSSYKPTDRQTDMTHTQTHKHIQTHRDRHPQNTRINITDACKEIPIYNLWIRSQEKFALNNSRSRFEDAEFPGTTPPIPD